MGKVVLGGMVFRYFVVFLVCAWGALSAQAVPINAIEQGDGYYLSLAFENEVVVVLDVDRRNNRVKIRRQKGYTEWVGPERLLTREDSVAEDVATTVGAAIVLGCIFLSETHCQDGASGGAKEPNAIPAAQRVPVINDVTDSLYYFAPLADGEWENVNDSALGWISEHVPKQGLYERVVSIRSKELDFLKRKGRKIYLLELTPASSNERSHALFAVGAGELDISVLKGTGPSLMDFLERNAIELRNERQALEYLKLFCSSISTEYGVYFVLDPKDARIPQEVRLHPHFRAPKFIGKKNGSYQFKAIMNHAGTYFESEFLVSPDGMVDLISDEPLVGVSDSRLVKVVEGRRKFLNIVRQ